MLESGVWPRLAVSRLPTLLANPVLLILACLVAYAWPIPSAPSVNPDSHLALTYAIVDDHAFLIDRYVTQLEIMDRASVGGHFYTDKLPMESFLAVPLYALLRLVVPPVGLLEPSQVAWVRYFLTLTVISLPTALGVGLPRGELMRLGAARATASLAALGYGLGSLVWPFATLYFSHSLAATCVLATWVWARRGQSRALVVAALGAFLEAPAALPAFVAVLLGAIVWHSRGAPVRWRPLLGSLLLALVPIALTAAYQMAVYGAPWRLAYENLAGSDSFRVGMSSGVLGVGWPRPDVVWQMLAVPRRGLLVANPVLLLALPAAVDVMRDRRPWEGAALATFGVCLVAMSGYLFWDGGSSIGPRHLVSALPLVFLASGALFRGAAAHALTVLSVCLMWLAVLAGVLYPPDIANPWTQAILKALAGDHATIDNWGKLALHREGWQGFAPLVLPIALAWPWGNPARGLHCCGGSRSRTRFGSP